MDRAKNADVEQALAAAGSQSLQYRAFARRGDTTEPRTRVAAAFPLLAVALPEIADQSVTAAGQTTPAPQIPRVSDDATTGRGEQISETIAPTAPSTAPHTAPPMAPMVSAPASEAVANAATAARAAVSLPAATASARSADTPLAAIFRLLRGQTKPPFAADLDALDELFRRL
jgi:hypothetical protein